MIDLKLIFFSVSGYYTKRVIVNELTDIVILTALAYALSTESLISQVFLTLGYNVIHSTEFDFKHFRENIGIR